MTLALASAIKCASHKILFLENLEACEKIKMLPAINGADGDDAAQQIIDKLRDPTRVRFHPTKKEKRICRPFECLHPR